MATYFTSFLKLIAVGVWCVGALQASAAAEDAGPRPADGASLVMADALLGEWHVTVEGEKRSRSLVIEAIGSAVGEKTTLQATYGWSDGALVKSPTSLEAGNGGAILNVLTPAKSKIAATWITPDLFEGTFETEKAVKKISIQKREAGEDDQPATSRGIKKLSVLYVGAFNCPSCDAWKRRDQRPEADLMKSVELRQVQTNSYSYISQDSAWPDDLKPIRDRLKLKSGTPRFIIIADDKVVLHRFGKAAWEKDVLPKLAQLTSARPRAQK
jgi:hypothetical protein